MWGDDNYAGTCDTGEKDDEVAIDAMEEDDFVPDHGHELEADEEGCWENAVKVQLNTSFEGFLEVVIAFSWCGACQCWVGVAEDGVEGQIFKSSQREAHDVADGDKPCD